MTITKIKALESGMAAFIGRRDIHVYCHNPMRLTMMPTGREGWKRYPEEARYMVVCPAAGLRLADWEGREWVTAVEAARLVDAALAGETVAAAA